MRISDWSSDVCSSDLHVGLAAAEVAALDGVVEEPVDGVAVGLVVLRRVDAALGRDRVRPAGAVVVRDDLDLVALLAERGCGRGAGEAGADDDDLELAPVVRRHELHVELVLRPLVGDVAGRAVAVKLTDHQCTASSYSVRLTVK